MNIPTKDEMDIWCSAIYADDWHNRLHRCIDAIQQLQAKRDELEDTLEHIMNDARTGSERQSVHECRNWLMLIEKKAQKAIGGDG